MAAIHLENLPSKCSDKCVEESTKLDDLKPEPSSSLASDSPTLLASKPDNVLLEWTANQVKTVSKADHVEAAETLALAFGKDLVARYCIDTPDRIKWSEERKWKLHVEIFNCVTHAHCKGGITTAAGTSGIRFGSVALWLPPKSNIEKLSVVFACGFWRLVIPYYRLSPVGIRRLRKFVHLLDTTKKEILAERANDCYYLVYIGTHPDARGRGLGAKLINDMAKRADEEGKCMYLESSNVVNVKLYKRCGFEVKKRIVLKDGKAEEVPLDIMVREPMVLPPMKAVDSGYEAGEPGPAENTKDY